MAWLPLVTERAVSAPDSAVSEFGHTQAPGEGRFVQARLGDQELLFSEAHQAVYELSDLAAHVWRSLEIGMTAQQIVSELCDNGVELELAQRSVESTLERLRSLRSIAIEPSPSPLSAMIGPLTRLTISIAGVAVQLHLSSSLVPDVEAVFGRLISDLPDTDCLVCARAVGGTVDFFVPGQPDWSCDRSEFIPLLKAQLIENVLQYARYEVALHAAALVRENDAVLLVGSPGAGKTTLAIALAKAGFEVLADDVALLDERGSVTGVTLPFTAKASSWPLLSRHWPGIANYPSHCRPDGQTLCYIPHDRIADPRPRRITSVILLDRRAHTPASIEELATADALSALVAEGATRDQMLSPSGFTALIEGLREARCLRLTYSDLIEAADAVCARLR